MIMKVKDMGNFSYTIYATFTLTHMTRLCPWAIRWTTKMVVWKIIK